MDEVLIKNWNSRVQPNDPVYILGDMFFHSMSRSIAIMHRLNGLKRIVLGNHDRVIRDNKALQNCFDDILSPIHNLFVNGKMAVLSHYPLLSWERAGQGSYMLHGHCHGSIPFDKNFRRLDVGTDPCGYYPISWNDVQTVLDKVEGKDYRGRDL